MLPRDPLEDPDREVLEGMCRTLRHRGPDDWGVALGSPRATWEAPTGNVVRFESHQSVGLGNTRLSILDPSGAGHQPMSTDDGRLWIVYNGELYNFRELRRDLEARGCRFRSRSDTEVVLRLYERLGRESFRLLNGMFSFAIWDGIRQELHLARDRFGVKPLYYASLPKGLVFASEIKALLRGGLAPRLSLEALDRYLSFLWVPEPETILEGVRKLPAGHSLRVRRGSSAELDLAPFWAPDAADCGADSRSEAEIAEDLLGRLTAAVSRQCVADVPVGAFLSGGLDSSAVVSLMVRTGHRPERVHAIGFTARDQRYERVPDDLLYARRLAANLGLAYEEVLLRPEMTALLPELVWFLDEPLADPAVIPTYLICRAARPYTKVLLSGMGADELFGGYRRHLSENLLALHSKLPRSVRSIVGRAAEALPSAGPFPLVPAFRRAKKLLRIADLPADERYIQACVWTDSATRQSLYSADARAALEGADAEARHRQVLDEAASADPVNRMLYADTHLYLPSHNLNYTDKMSMAASVEVRVPFLDNDVADLAFRLPSSLKVRGLQGKRILRRALEPVLPRAILRRGKTGFAAPIRSWIVNDLHGMLHDLLAPDRVSRRGLFDPAAVSRLLLDRRGGAEDRSHQIWALLTLELWMQAYLDRVPHEAAAPIR